MNLPEINTNLFKRLRFILVETSRAGNIGAVARAMKTMGFTDLVLVSPRFEGALDDPEAIAFASGAGDILAAARVVDNMAEALQGIHFAAAVSARLREYSPPVLTPRMLAGQLLAQPELHAALIFGNERFGLPNQIVEQCNVLINIPANPDYSSLNLSQAAQVLAYECRMAALDGTPSVRQPGGDANDIGFQGAAASVAQIEGMYQHLEQALVAIGFLDAGNPRKLMPRLKRMFARAHLEQEEVNILRGIARHMAGRRPAAGDN
ncbi:RNA methyltransferase [Duganella qianjiadongensis]|uniref:tRNA (cytidine/uridine-2'-O-)-methyltransferase TrmJ n=1 Tax=Duganella qianjiadongensis TaxID=2692176 RepID=A0ABW9VF87_9BURK|nr:RNA methyltransferase [Duganella qianjiadongensis]MYM38186.1 TrmJ/YjtD family RNA methyltransferase [Duganella qianjiadongensis]